MTALYHSTNRELAGDARSDSVSFPDALFRGLAPDGGLFLPDRIPAFTEAELRDLRGQPYPSVACAVLGKFLVPEMDDASLERLTREAYDFEIPIESIDARTWIARLDRGPTASFKDFAAAFMARAMSHWRPADRHVTILVATSGDTGSAVGEAYRGLEGFDVVILYPAAEVSADQKRQLDSIGGNVRAVSMEGKFDDCQECVKRAFTDPELESLHLTSANSINIGRLLPQVVYYFHIYLQVARDLEPILFSIPSGNFGNSLGCELARRMGLPVARMILAVNENDEFPVFLETGEYRKIEPSRACLSNAMNVGNPSNLARFFDLFGGALTREGIVRRMPDLDAMRRRLSSVSVSDAETVDTIRALYAEKGVLVEPHGAVGIEALRRYRESERDDTPAVCLETAHPGKFRDALREILNVDVAPPASFERYQDRESRVDSLDGAYEALKAYLIGSP